MTSLPTLPAEPAAPGVPPRTPAQASMISPPEALGPRQMALRAVSTAVGKSGEDALTTFVLSVLAGAFIGFGAMFATVVSATVPGSAALPYGISKGLMGLAFSVGLILVVVGGAQLFTSNVLLVMAWASGRITGVAVLRNWVLVYAGNFAGAAGTAALVVYSHEYRSAAGGVGLNALNIAEGKGELGFGQALVLGVLCNVLVCLAVWLSYSARTTTDRIAAVVMPVAAFVAGGFEHSVANMYYLPLAAMIRSSAPSSFWASTGTTPDAFGHVGWTAFAQNLLPVTIGNIIGGGLIVGGLYWVAYLRHDRPETGGAAAGS
ncbi:formate/nitrite transporter family protein [Kineosporia sp. J2-2]|uniref:Formate/nitrite transporter family protein n=1 Tax=Kineosporia corallincola TaxID=2835133 RepID=A0ABS5TPE1_9ACTN|nr:formate/nitrite transporter family protein [Kineosporia corallincola]MBT0771459.1 formate/nitrite transporter family protein [Kineosporia corallincola]